MSWGDIFFGFRGRINRKTYWAGSVLVGLAGFLFAALLAYLATGNPLAPEVWERPADKASIWGPVWLAYFGFLVWPSTALAVKRLHDRDRPVLDRMPIIRSRLPYRSCRSGRHSRPRPTRRPAFLQRRSHSSPDTSSLSLAFFAELPGRTSTGTIRFRRIITAAISISGAGCLRWRGASAARSGGLAFLS